MRSAAVGFVEINGRIVHAARARVSAFDRGLLYGDGLFETLRAYRGRPFGLEEHVARLQASARFLGIALPRKPWERDIRALLARNGLQSSDAWVRISVTRGAAPPGLLPPARIRPTLIVMAGPLGRAIRSAQRRGVGVTLLPFARDGFLGEHKVLNYLPAVLGRVIATRHGAFEGLFAESTGRLTEGTTSNLFVWRQAQLRTPPVRGLLPGLTRRLVMETAVAAGIRVGERDLHIPDLLDADEAFLTSSLIEIVPVTSVDGRPIGDGRVGARTQRLQQLYRQMVDHTLTQRLPR